MIGPELTITPSIAGIGLRQMRAAVDALSGPCTTTVIGKSILPGELEVALVVRWHGHDRARAIARQHIVGDPDRDALVVDRIDRIATGPDAGLFLIGRLALDLGLAARLQLILPRQLPAVRAW